MKVKFKGGFIVECYRKGELLWREDVHNIITNQGLTHILSTELAGGTAITTWYCTLVESNTTATAAMTYAVPVYTESTAYDEATRPAYTETVTDQSCTNSASKAEFTINATKTMYGASLVGGGSAATTKGNTAGGGTLLCYAKFSASRAVVDDDILQLTYTITAADDGA
uniref:Uncharacterized protein n=1 Tax=viral metagenome TaxID=1070528 RepID=A0A6M3L742_9ZZZZ